MSRLDEINLVDVRLVYGRLETIKTAKFCYQIGSVDSMTTNPLTNLSYDNVDLKKILLFCNFQFWQIRGAVGKINKFVLNFQNYPLSPSMYGP